ncbi:MAG: DUF1016 N-terminal domain-containing protein [Clostridiales bacterium]|jgi:hypothetical protein|nr:DUF1016 N-terminal domain-containing protein [Clostridiales bacterium]
MAAVNFAMVESYWEIGRQIEDAAGERAEYGKGLLKYLPSGLTAKFGKGFYERNLCSMRQFYQTFSIRNALRSELSWTHNRLIMKAENVNARQLLHPRTNERRRQSAEWDYPPRGQKRECREIYAA